MAFEVILHVLKNLCLHNVDNLEKIFKDWALNNKHIAEADNLKFEDDLM